MAQQNPSEAFYVKEATSLPGSPALVRAAGACILGAGSQWADRGLGSVGSGSRVVEDLERASPSHRTPHVDGNMEDAPSQPPARRLLALSQPPWGSGASGAHFCQTASVCGGDEPCLGVLRYEKSRGTSLGAWRPLRNPFTVVLWDRSLL